MGSTSADRMRKMRARQATANLVPVPVIGLGSAEDDARLAEVARFLDHVVGLTEGSGRPSADLMRLAEIAAEWQEKLAAIRAPMLAQAAQVAARKPGHIVIPWADKGYQVEIASTGPVRLAQRNLGHVLAAIAAESADLRDLRAGLRSAGVIISRSRIAFDPDSAVYAFYTAQQPLVAEDAPDVGAILRGEAE